MALGLENIPGLDSLGGLNLSQIGSGVGQLILVLIIFGITAIAVGIIYWWYGNKKQYNKFIHWFEEINGEPVAMGTDLARELIIPNSNIPVFHVKGKDIYLPRPTIQSGKNRYWYYIKKNREIVNYRQGAFSDKTGTTEPEYDHTDMRYGLANLRALIQRNYRDKSEPWWKAYKDVISTVIFIFIVTVALWFLIDKIGEVADTVNGALSIISQSCPALSGVAPG